MAYQKGERMAREGERRLEQVREERAERAEVRLGRRSGRNGRALRGLRGALDEVHELLVAQVRVVQQRAVERLADDSRLLHERRVEQLAGAGLLAHALPANAPTPWHNLFLRAVVLLVPMFPHVRVGSALRTNIVTNINPEE